DHALEIANDTEFGLTGAVYSSSRDKLERAVRDFHVGNLYLNRKCTGAMVGAHPFGGFNMSGTDSKSGGPDYLYLFTQAKSVGDKIVECGRGPSCPPETLGRARMSDPHGGVTALSPTDTSRPHDRRNGRVSLPRDCRARPPSACHPRSVRCWF